MREQLEIYIVGGAAAVAYLAVRMKALTGRQITNAFAGEARRTHHFNDIKARPGDIIAEHLYLE